MQFRQDKLPNLLDLIKNCLESGNYRSCLHLEQRELERNITRREVLHVLLNGFHEKKKDGYDETHKTWNYAIRGKTLDKRDLRVFISFDEKTMMLIITAYEIGK